MSEWNRDQRDERRGDRARDQRGEGSFPPRDARWGDQQRSGEQRSFGGPDYGGQYGGQGYGAGRQQEGYRSGSEGQDYGREGYGRQASSGPSDRLQGYGARQAYEPNYESRQREAWREQQGERGSQFTGRNEYVQEVTDGDSDHGMWSLLNRGDHGRGEHRGRGPKNYTRSDDRIREDVNDRLTHDSRLDATEIDVQVSQCEVTLSGTVNSRDDKRIAEDIAEQASGVKHVQNNLRVQQQGDQTRSGQSSASAIGGGARQI